MGGGSASSQKIDEETTQITTTTTTTVGDIGLTGDDAVDMAALLESGTTERMKIAGDVIKNLINTTGEGYNQLIAGAGNLVLEAGKASEEIVEKSKESDKSDLVKALPWITLAGATAIIAAVSFRN